MSVSVDFQVLQLLSSRLCHEFAGAVGAINNGIELIADSPETPDPDAFDLIAGSAREMAARLRYLRIAYGFSAGAANAAQEVRELAGAIFGEGRVSLDWEPGPEDLASGYSDGGTKLILNLVLLAGECLPRGGSVGVRIVGSGDARDAIVTAAGEGARLSEGARTAFDPEIDVGQLTARTVQGFFVARLAETCGTGLSLDDSVADVVTMMVRLPAG